jgi:hypothetical protein
MNVIRRSSLWVVLLCATAAVFGCNRDSQKSKREQQQASNDVVAKSTLLTTIPDHDKPNTVDSASANKPSYYIDFNKLGAGVVYIAEQAGKLHVVHNGLVGKPYQMIDNVRISPDGKRVAYVVPLNGKSSLVLDGREGPAFDDISAPLFSPDSRHVLYKVREGVQFRIVVDGKIDSPYRQYTGDPLFAADSETIAHAEGAEGNRPARLIVSDLGFKPKGIKESCGEKMVTNADKTRISAVCVTNGKRKVIEFSFAQPERTSEGQLYDSISNLTFSKDGTALAYVAEKGETSYLILNGREEQLPKAMLVADPVIRPDKQGAVVIMATTEKVFLHQAFSDPGTKGKMYELIENFVYNQDGSRYAFAALKEKKWRIVVNGTEGPPFERVVDPLFSPDGKNLVYRARQDGKRFVVVADADGTNIRWHQSYELVYPTVFTTDGASVAYGVKDGKELWWKVEKLP